MATMCSTLNQPLPVHTCKTLKDAVYDKPFLPYYLMNDWILSIPKRNKNIQPYNVMTWMAEYGYDQHRHLVLLHEGRGDKVQLAKDLGNSCNCLEQMQAVFYIYFHMINERCVEAGANYEQTWDLIYEIVKEPLEENWVGIHGWLN